MDNLERQMDEIEALKSIYGTEFDARAGNCSIELVCNDIRINLCFTLSDGYPSLSPPICEMSAPALSKTQKDDIYQALNDIYLENLGETILYQWIERVREILESLEPIATNPVSKQDSFLSFEFFREELNDDSLCPKIIHGEIIEDRKSAFQGHVASLSCENDVNLVLHHLKRERKIADATHNVMAWRFGTHQDYDDDGEKGAGAKLLNLLLLAKVNNVVVFVSRWYGGILLGKIRFRHINNAARQALVQAKLIDN